MVVGCVEMCCGCFDFFYLYVCECIVGVCLFCEFVVFYVFVMFDLWCDVWWMQCWNLCMGCMWCFEIECGCVVVVGG